MYLLRLNCDNLLIVKEYNDIINLYAYIDAIKTCHKNISYKIYKVTIII